MGEFASLGLLPITITFLSTLGFLFLGWQALQSLKK